MGDLGATRWLLFMVWFLGLGDGCNDGITPFWDDWDQDNECV